MAESIIKGGLINYSGSKSIASGNLTNLVPSFTLPSTGIWLIEAKVWVTTSGSTTAMLHNRLHVGGNEYYAQDSAVTLFDVNNYAITTGGAVYLDTFQNSGSAQTVAYELTAIEIA